MAVAHSIATFSGSFAPDSARLKPVDSTHSHIRTKGFIDQHVPYYSKNMSILDYKL